MPSPSALAWRRAPVIHLAHSVVWLGYGPLVMSISRPVATVARTPVFYATFPQARVAALLREQPAGWQAVARLVGEFALLASVIAADLLIPASEQRCAAVLLRLAGQRFASPRDAVEVMVPVTQEELAAAANLSRNSAGAILRALRRADGSRRAMAASGCAHPPGCARSSTKVIRRGASVQTRRAPRCSRGSRGGRRGGSG